MQMYIKPTQCVSFSTSIIIVQPPKVCSEFSGNYCSHNAIYYTVYFNRN